VQKNHRYFIAVDKTPPAQAILQPAFVVGPEGEIVFKQVRRCRFSFSPTACRQRSKKFGTRLGAKLASAFVMTLAMRASSTV